MSILFIENKKRLEFDITGYEFPDIRKLNIDHDANWLAVTFSYQDDKLSFKKADNCLLTYEIEEIIHALEKILAGEETGCILTFLEPWLTISVTKTHDEYAFQFRYVYDTADDVWKEIYICQSMSSQDLHDLYQHFKAYLDKYPLRKAVKKS